MVLAQRDYCKLPSTISHICPQSQLKWFFYFIIIFLPQRVSAPMDHLQVEHNINISVAIAGMYEKL
jgi:hypothetical protein